MKPFALVFASLLLLAGCNVSFHSDSGSNLPRPTPGTQAQRDEAERAARDYLVMLDRGDYDATWDHAGPALRAQTNRFVWTNTMKLARKTLQAPPERSASDIGFTPKVDPNAPAGEYAFVAFQGTVGRVATTEKVVMQKEASRWKIVGYFMFSRTKLGG